MRLAIVIPTLNEELALRDLLPRVLPLADEVRISDGGSTDATVRTAEELGARVVTGPPGRGRQLNRGARATTAEILIFLHADTRLPAAAPQLVLSAIAGGAVGGGFRMTYGREHPARGLAEGLVNLRTRLTGCPLGDQAQFVRREAFDVLDGFRDWPILEDLDFIRRLKRHGRTVTLDAAVTTSARRVTRQGLARTTAVNWLIWTLYFAGVSPHRLARLYRHIR